MPTLGYWKIRGDLKKLHSTFCSDDLSDRPIKMQPSDSGYTAQMIKPEDYIEVIRTESRMGFLQILHALAQPIRLLLNYAGEDFEDVQYEQGDGPEFSREAWLSVKTTLGLPFPNLPYYIDGDIKITQSNSILRYIARKHNLLGGTTKEIVDCDVMLENAMDFRNAVVRLAYNAKYEEIKEDHFKSVIPALEVFEKFLGSKSWFAGEKITVCDFPMYELLDQHKIMKPGILDQYPKLTSFCKRFEELPAIKKYMSSDKFMKRPINNKVAAFK